MAKAKTNGKKKQPRTRKKSKAEDMTGAKAAAVETKRVGELDLPEPIQIESRDYDIHYKAIKAALEKKDTAVGLVRATVKAAKFINKHLPETIKRMIALERKDDAADLKAELEVLGFALKESGSPIQLSIHNMLLGDPEEQAYNLGFSMGKAGKQAASPYGKGTAYDEQYAAGWRNGQAELMRLPPEQRRAALEGEAEEEEIEHEAEEHAAAGGNDTWVNEPEVEPGIGHNSEESAEGRGLGE